MVYGKYRFMRVQSKQLPGRHTISILKGFLVSVKWAQSPYANTVVRNLGALS